MRRVWNGKKQMRNRKKEKKSFQSSISKSDKTICLGLLTSRRSVLWRAIIAPPCNPMERCLAATTAPKDVLKALSKASISVAAVREVVIGKETHPLRTRESITVRAIGPVQSQRYRSRINNKPVPSNRSSCPIPQRQNFRVSREASWRKSTS